MPHIGNGVLCGVNWQFIDTCNQKFWSKMALQKHTKRCNSTMGRRVEIGIIFLGVGVVDIDQFVLLIFLSF